MDTDVEIVVKGRNVEVPDHFRQHVAEKLASIDRFDGKIMRVEVELFHEPNPRQGAVGQRVEITCFSRGPVVRAEAGNGDFYRALDVAAGKLAARLRKLADRRRVHHGRHAPVSVAVATAPLATADSDALREPEPEPGAVKAAIDEAEAAMEPWHIARAKEHRAAPMTVDDALFQMELVGHDFYLFQDKQTGQPSVVYRRHKGYDYGVISLATA